MRNPKTAPGHAFGVDVQHVAGLAAAGLVALTGVALLAARPRRNGAVFFPMFCMVWGVGTAASYVADLSSSDASYRLFRSLTIVMLAPLPLLLVRFATQWPWKPGRLSSGWTWASAAIGAAGAIGFLLAPRAFVTYETGPDGRASALGAPALLLLVAPFFASLYLSWAILLSKFFSLSDTLLRRETAIVLSAIGLYVGYVTPFNVVFYVVGFGAEARLQGPLVAWTYVAVFGGGTLVLLVSLFALARRARTAQAAPDRHVLTALVAAIALGVAFAVPLFYGKDLYYGFAISRFVAVAVLSYGILKHQLFGIDLGVKAFLRSSMVATPIVVTFFIASELLSNYIQQVSGSTVASIGAAGIVALSVGRPINRLAGRIAEKAMPGVQRTPAYAASRTSDIYQASLEAVLVDGIMTGAERDVLERMRTKLGLSPIEAKEIERNVRSSEGIVLSQAGP
jgi:hypothetical protein